MPAAGICSPMALYEKVFDNSYLGSNPSLKLAGPFTLNVSDCAVKCAVTATCKGFGYSSGVGLPFVI
ncbi:unnamed protein product [Protopolystoma xenopodis]|uniref:Uncharacterized protein n=1 Tax=Protopolystoma xenopodis TaxID=117903 RepID=A0A448XAP2_9PLAT|nr:unnamed protein product [Protopolystoma xenopodis]